MTTVAFFNNKGGVGKTSLVYHLAWMLASEGRRVLAADLDPQANLTSMFVSDERLEELWSHEHRPTMYGAVEHLFGRIGDVVAPHVEMADDGLGLICGDLLLSDFEDALSSSWPLCSNGDAGAFRAMSAFARAIAMAKATMKADIVLMDVGPNLGALNRAALIGADHVVVPLGADLFSLQGLRNMGPTLRSWRARWAERRALNPVRSLVLPEGKMRPAGYVVMRHSVRLDRPARAYDRWIGRIPDSYRTHVLDQPTTNVIDPDNDPERLALMKDYRSLMPLAQEARKPMFLLRAGDGAFGGHQQAVQECHRDFWLLSDRVLEACGLEGLL